MSKEAEDALFELIHNRLKPWERMSEVSKGIAYDIFTSITNGKIPDVVYLDGKAVNLPLMSTAYCLMSKEMVDAYLQLFKEVEWSVFDSVLGGFSCPVCHSQQSRGHIEGCKYRKISGRTP